MEGLRIIRTGAEMGRRYTQYLHMSVKKIYFLYNIPNNIIHVRGGVAQNPSAAAADEPCVHRDTPLVCACGPRADRSAGSRYADTGHVARSIHHRPPPRVSRQTSCRRVETINYNRRVDNIYIHGLCRVWLVYNMVHII